MKSSATLAWSIELSEDAVRQMEKLGHPASARIRKFLRERISVLLDPRMLGSALQGKQFEHMWRYRVGDYRVLCEIVDKRLVVVVVEVGHRREIYR